MISKLFLSVYYGNFLKKKYLSLCILKMFLNINKSSLCLCFVQVSDYKVCHRESAFYACHEVRYVNCVLI